MFRMYHVRILLLCFVIIAFSSSILAKAKGPVLWNLQELSQNAQSQQWLNSKIAKAEEALNGELLTVTKKSKSISGDFHNYESLAYYAWPNPDDPTGPYVERDGQPSPEYKYYDGERLAQLNKRFVALGEAYYLTCDKRYADCMKEQLRAWFVDAPTRMNPNFTYGQFIPGLRSNGGFPGSISEAYYFVNILECIAIMKQNKTMDKKLDKQLKKWFAELSKWLRYSDLGNEMASVKDNLAIIYDVLVYRISMYTGDKKTCKAIAVEFPSRRLATHIAVDGSQPQELKRTKAMSYSIYNLQHIVDLCCMMECDGRHFYAQNHIAIDAAADYISKYIDNKNSFPYKEIGDWALYQRQFKNLQIQLDNLRQKK